MMQIEEIARLIDARICSGGDRLQTVIEFAAASDLMSDVLTIHHDNMALLTGLANVQTIRTAEMSDIHCVILLRGKRATPEMAELANEHNIVLLESPLTLFKACGVLYAAGIQPVY
jgi:predicted transcriptional regulator